MPSSPVDIPHHTQETDHTCGPAAVRMALEAIWGLRVEEESLAKQMGTTPDIGTRQKVMARLMETLGLNAVVRHTDTTLDELRQLVDTHVVIVCYWLAPEDTDHYAVVVAINDRRVRLHDPWVGPETEMTVADFDAHWYGDATVEGRRDRWLLAIPVPEAA